MEKYYSPLESIATWLESLNPSFIEDFEFFFIYFFPPELKESIKANNIDLDYKILVDYLKNNKITDPRNVLSQTIIIRECINLAFEGQKTLEDWNVVKEKLQNKLIDYNSVDYFKNLTEDFDLEMTDGAFNHMSKASKHMADSLEKIDERAEKYIKAYSEWEKLINDKISNPNLKKWFENTMKAIAFRDMGKNL